MPQKTNKHIHIMLCGFSSWPRRWKPGGTARSPCQVSSAVGNRDFWQIVLVVIHQPVFIMESWCLLGVAAGQWLLHINLQTPPLEPCNTLEPLHTNATE